MTILAVLIFCLDIKSFFIMFTAYIALIVLCILTLLVNRQNLPRYFIYLLVLLSIVVIVEILEEYLQRIHINSYPLDHLYQPIEFGLLSIVYFKSFENPLIKKLLKTITPIFILYALIMSIFVEGIFHINTISFLTSCFLFVVISILYILELYFKNEEENPAKDPFFWINTGILFYSCGVFLQMGLYNFFENRAPDIAKQLNIINQLLNFFLYFNFLIGFMCKRTIPK
jgi:hypothetical protein